MRKIFAVAVFYMGLLTGCATTVAVDSISTATTPSPSPSIVVTLDKIPPEFIGVWKVVIGSNDGGKTSGTPTKDMILTITETDITLNNNDLVLMETLVLYRPDIKQYKITFYDSEEWIVGLDDKGYLLVVVYDLGQEQVRLLLQKNGTSFVVPKEFHNKVDNTIAA